MSSGVKYGLGLDQGVASIGWTILRLDAHNTAVGIEKMGVHLFEAGTDGDIESGRDSSRSTDRRLARQVRKQCRRRVLRKKKLLRALQELGLLPSGPIETPEKRDSLLRQIDAELRAKWEADASVDHRARQLLPYRIRAAGLSSPLEPMEVGRALYHLAQRRGYMSNRRVESETKEHNTLPAAASKHPQSSTPPQSSAKEHPETAVHTQPSNSSVKDDASVVRAAIVELERQVSGAGCKTLAEYFTKLDPTGKIGDRLRGRWTSRDMFVEEFDRLWQEQAKHNPAMTDQAKRRVHRAIFFQRPLQSMSHLIGTCELVPGAKRLLLGHRLAQRFRLLQKVNDLVVHLPDYTKRHLSRMERERLINALNQQSEIAFSKLKTKKWFALPEGTVFNLETGGETKLIGNRTEAKCRHVFGEDRWNAMSDSDKDAVVQDLLVFEKPTALENRGKETWGLSAEQARLLSDCVLEQGYSRHCAEALRKLVPRLEEGTPYATAVKDEFGRDEAVSEVHDLLPPVERSLGQLRNPTVTRALTELRKFVNEVVRRYGKPAWIRIELSRDMKRARKVRERISKEMRVQQTRRDGARARILRETNHSLVSRSDVERVLLAEECGWICPYTGKPFGMTDVVGRHPQVDVEHIWPLSCSLDDSFLNKTLCFVDENRNVKKNRTPFEAYSRTPETWSAILERVKRFRSDAARFKLERFVAPEIPDDFANRHLSETRKIGAASAAYLGLLYGGEVDDHHKRRVFVTTGGLTAHLRREWHLHAILSDDGEKSREDHRHHAIDALVVALTDSRAVQSLQRAAQQASSVGRRLFAPVDDPWHGFVDDARKHVEAILVSFRQSRRVSGKLHGDSNYSRPTGPQGERRIRKELAKLSETEVDSIVDPKVRRAVQAKLSELNGPPKKVFSLPQNHPFTVTKSGGKNWIHKVRIAITDKPREIGKGARLRFVTSTQGSNHHTVIKRLPNGKWTDTPVALIDIRTVQVPANRPHGGVEFTLAAGDFVLLKDSAGKEKLLRVTKISDGQIAMISHADARANDDIKRARAVVYRSGSSLMRDGGKKVSITYLGEVRRAGG